MIKTPDRGETDPGGEETAPLKTRDQAESPATQDSVSTATITATTGPTIDPKKDQDQGKKGETENGRSMTPYLREKREEGLQKKEQVPAKEERHSV